MTTITRRIGALTASLGLAALLGAALAGCATPAGEATSTPAPVDESTSAPDDDMDVEAAWLDDGRLIGIVTYGSSGCVPVAEEPVLNGSVLEVTFVEPEEDVACTADYAPRVTIVGVPEGVDPSQDLEITVSGTDYSGDTTLDGVDGLVGGGATEYLPSAGWTGEDGQFVILSWGSSSCPPMLETVEATGEDEITATFATPPADQVCTMDMAPRALVAVVVDDVADGDTFLVMQGGEFDNIRIPILGSH